MQIQSFDYQQRVAGEVMLTVHVWSYQDLVDT